MSLVLAGLLTSRVPATHYVQTPATSLVVFGIVALAWRKPFIGGVACTL
jgi:hypothetical protein